MNTKLVDRFHSNTSDYIILRYKDEEIAELIRNGKPGQCLKIEDNYYAISSVNDDTFDVMTKIDSYISNIVSPFIDNQLYGQGFQKLDCENAVVLSIGTGAGLGCFLTEWRKNNGYHHTHFTAFTRGNTPIDQRISSLGNHWNTKINPRPFTALYTVGVQELHPIDSKTKVFPIGSSAFIQHVKNIMKNDYNMNDDCVITNY